MGTIIHRPKRCFGSIALVLFIAGVFTPAAVTAQGERKAIESLFTAWNSGDTERVVAAFSSDAIYEDVAAGGLHRGRDEIRKWVAGAFRDIDRFKLEIVKSSFYKGGGTIEWVWSGTDKGLFKTGKSFSVRGVSVVQVREGRVSQYTEYYDFGKVMRDLGPLPVEKE